MLRHSEIWRALDRLAAKHGLSASGLARRAGLDPTAFNKSKRKSPTGKPRWPSTESVSKCLTATGESLGGFLALIGERSGVTVTRPLPLAPVSMPLKWDELGKVYPTDFTILTVPDHLERTGDPWADILAAKHDLGEALGKTA